MGKPEASPPRWPLHFSRWCSGSDRAIATGSPLTWWCFDAAHGGDDTGARLGSEPEKTYTLAMSVRLRSLLDGARNHGGDDAGIRHDGRCRPARGDRQPRQCPGLPEFARFGKRIWRPCFCFFACARSSQRRSFRGRLRSPHGFRSSLALAGTINSALTHAGVSVTLGTHRAAWDR